jgi:hypothetical protein
MRRGRRSTALVLLAVAVLAPLAAPAASPLEAPRRGREIETPAAVTRDFPIGDANRALRLAITALQDLGFALESADAERGGISASRLDVYPLRLTLAITAQDTGGVRISVTADYAGEPTSAGRAAETLLETIQDALNPRPVLE